MKEYVERVMREEFEYCRTHPIYFIENYCVIEDKDAPEVIVPFVPWPSQKKVLRELYENRLNLILKARQMGMTWLALYVCVHDLIFHPGHTVIALSKTENDAKELVRRVGVIVSSMPEILRAGNLTMRRSALGVSIAEQNGRRVSAFQAFSASPSAGRSFTANILLLDEWAFQEWAEEIYTSVYPTINRPTGGKIIGLSTIKRGTLFEKLWTEDNAFHKIFLSVFADPRRTEDWYIRTAADMGERVKQEYPRTPEEALAGAGGCFFSEFDYGVHTCEPFPIPRHWPVYDTMDYGLDMFAHYKIAVDEAGNCYVFHEIYKSSLIISEAAERVRRAEVTDDGDAWYPPRERLAPPDLWSRSPESGKSKAFVFGENGLALTKSSNDREAGWLAVKELMRVRVGADGKKTARLHVFRNCENLIRTLSMILYDPKNPNDCARDPHELTHAPDALRYFAVRVTEPAERGTGRIVPYSPSVYADYLRADEEMRRVIEERMGGAPMPAGIGE